MDKAQQRALSALKTPEGISVDPATGFVYRTGWPRPGLRLEPVGGRFTVRCCSFRTGGFTPSEVVRVDATAGDVWRALYVFAAMAPTKANLGFAAWRRAVTVVLYA